jgi:hypothetical protein
MRYAKYQDDYTHLGQAITYLETDETGWARRQITFNGKEYLASNVNYPHYGMVLADQPLSDEDLASLEPAEMEWVSREEFLTIWNAHLAERKSIWEAAKVTYPIGKKVWGHLLIFYPQGVIVDLENDVLGLADYKACKASTTPENMYPRHIVTAVVSGYDDENQWVLLDAPQVQREEVKLPPKLNFQ